MCFRFKSHLHPDFSSIETTVRYTSLQWSPGVLGVPHMSRQLKAFAGSRFDANLCADVYNLYVKRNISHGECINFLANHFIVPSYFLG
jgi:hypothetical protein